MAFFDSYQGALEAVASLPDEFIPEADCVGIERDGDGDGSPPRIYASADDAAAVTERLASLAETLDGRGARRRLAELLKNGPDGAASLTIVALVGATTAAVVDEAADDSTAATAAFAPLLPRHLTLALDGGLRIASLHARVTGAERELQLLVRLADGTVLAERAALVAEMIVSSLRRLAARAAEDAGVAVAAGVARVGVVGDAVCGRAREGDVLLRRLSGGGSSVASPEIVARARVLQAAVAARAEAEERESDEAAGVPSSRLPLESVPAALAVEGVRCGAGAVVALSLQRAKVFAGSGVATVGDLFRAFVDRTGSSPSEKTVDACKGGAQGVVVSTSAYV